MRLTWIGRSVVKPAMAALLYVCLVAALRAQAQESAAYVGGQACAGCHANETALWQISHHARAMQKATSATVLGNFADASVDHAGINSTFSHSGDGFIIHTDGPEGAMRAYQVAYTFGVDPLQQYLIAFPGGRYQAFGVAWDSRPLDQGGQRWFHLYPDQKLAAGDRLHWTGRDRPGTTSVPTVTRPICGRTSIW